MLFLGWQDPSSRAWFPIGKLIYDGKLYYFAYLQGALEAQQKADFQPLLSFPDLHQTYGSPELFPLFANRLLCNLTTEWSEDFYPFSSLSYQESLPEESPVPPNPASSPKPSDP